MKRILIALALLLAPALAQAQCNGVVASGTICGNVTGTNNTMRPTSTSVITGIPGGSNGQIQYNNTGAFGGFTMGGAGSVDTSTGVLSLTPLGITSSLIAANAVTNAKLATVTQNTIKGAATSTSPTDLAAPSCSGAANALQWLTNTGLQCATLGNVTGSGSPTIGDLAAFSSVTATAISGTGYNAKQIPGLTPSTSTVTITNASPGVVTWNSHGLSANDTVFFCTTGALPTGLSACSPATGAVSANTYTQNPTLYYVVGSSITANTFTVATSIANAKASVAVNTSSAGSGTHTGFANAMACAGCVGEYIYKFVPIASGIALSSGSAGQLLTSIGLSTGIWDVSGNAGVLGAAGALITHLHGSIVHGFTTIATSPYGHIVAAHVDANSANGYIYPNTTQQIFVTSATDISLVVTADFTVATAIGYGLIWAKRSK